MHRHTEHTEHTVHIHPVPNVLMDRPGDTPRLPMKQTLPNCPIGTFKAQECLMYLIYLDIS